MKLIFLYGPAAAGKLTIGRKLADRTGFALFHNHLIVDAVATLFPFGSDEFVRLRDVFWMEAMESAARQGQSLIFTFAPESTVAPDFPSRLAERVRQCGGDIIFIALTIDHAEQDRRIGNADRAKFGKLTSLDLLRTLRPQFDRAMAAMPAAVLTIDTAATSPEDAAEQIAAMLSE